MFIHRPIRPVFLNTNTFMGSMLIVNIVEYASREKTALAEIGFPRGNHLWIIVVIFKCFFVSGFPHLACGFIASLRGLSGLHLTRKPLIRIGDSNLCPKTHHQRVNTIREANKYKPAIHNYLLIASNYRSVTGFTGEQLKIMNKCLSAIFDVKTPLLSIWLVWSIMAASHRWENGRIL